MNRSVVYQETSNNFSNIDQKINGAQIATIRHFGISPPSGAGDFPGQLGTAVTAGGESVLYVWTNAEWKVVGKSGEVDLPDVVVREDRKNNFTDPDQTIEDCQIPFISVGTNVQTTVTPIGMGHIYIRDVSPIEMYISYDAVTWTPIGTTTGTVELDRPNNFINPNQEIQGHAIVNVLKGSQAPENMGVLPTREGELYIQVAEGTSDKKARMWIANHTGSGNYAWEALTHMFEIPATVAMTSKSNNFQPTDQKIAGRQILTFIDGGNQNPGDAGAVPDYEGQLYVASHTNVQGNEDAAVWIARNGKWLPIQQDIDIRNIAYTNKSNRFIEPEQLLGEGGPNARWLIGARKKFDGNSPTADSKWKVQNIGEITVFKNTTVTPNQYSIWMGISKNANPDSNAGEWAMVWSSAQANANDVAYTNKQNEFVPFQKINNGGRKSLITTGHEGGVASPKGAIPPVAPGDTYTQSYSHPGFGETRNIWMAAVEGDSASWKRMLSEDDHDVILSTRPNNFTSRDQFLGDPASTKRDRLMGARKNNTEGPAYNGVAPTQFGEVVVCEEWDPTDATNVDKKICVAYLAVGSGRKSWIEIGRRLVKDLEIIDDGTNN